MMENFSSLNEYLVQSGFCGDAEISGEGIGFIKFREVIKRITAVLQIGRSFIVNGAELQVFGLRQVLLIDAARASEAFALNVEISVRRIMVHCRRPRNFRVGQTRRQTDRVFVGWR